ncbi:MAG: DUF429 domain-containing protein [Comamonadaceae bacterium]|nr:DUF429 domain-containing protein [Comamonadaceae bacterium]
MSPLANVASPALVGCDFSSAPSRRKPIVLALGALSSECVQLSSLAYFASLAEFSQWLAAPTAWVGAFDLPFGLPRELVQHLGWPLDWLACMHHYASLSRADIRAQFAAFCAARTPGGKFAHRATDRPAGASPSMKWVNPPVAYMLHAGVQLLLQSGVSLPGLHTTTPSLPHDMQRIALEAYPGMLAREVLGRRSYKSDRLAGHTADRLIARKDLITALEDDNTRFGPGLRLKLSHAQRDLLADDARGDRLDAVLCLMQAAWAQQKFEQGDKNYGLPADMDPLEGWIVGA